MLHGSTSSSASAVAAALVASARSSIATPPFRTFACQRDVRSRWTAATPQGTTHSRAASTLVAHNKGSCRRALNASLSTRRMSSHAVGRSPSTIISRWATTPILSVHKAGTSLQGVTSIQCSHTAVQSRLSLRFFSSASFRSLQAASPTIPIDQSSINQPSSTSSTASSTPQQQTQTESTRQKRKPRRRFWILSIAGAIALAGLIGWNFIPSVRRFIIALKRCAIVAVAVAECIVDYKLLFRKEWDDPMVRHNDYKACHSELDFQLLMHKRSDIGAGRPDADTCHIG